MNDTVEKIIENANKEEIQKLFFHYEGLEAMALITHKIMGFKGHWKGLDRSKNSDLSCVLMGIVSELGEAYEALRCNKRLNQDDLRTYFGEWDDEDARQKFFEERIDNTYEVEVWDALSRILDLAGASIENFDRVAQAKREYNFTRPYKHGKEF